MTAILVYWLQKYNFLPKHANILKEILCFIVFFVTLRRKRANKYK